MKNIAAFLGGALVGAAAALLLAPQSGEDTRTQLREILRRRMAQAKEEKDELGELIEQITGEIEG